MFQLPVQLYHLKAEVLFLETFKLFHFVKVSRQILEHVMWIPFDKTWSLCLPKSSLPLGQLCATCVTGPPDGSSLCHCEVNSRDAYLLSF